MKISKASNNLAIIATNIGSIGGINHLKNLAKHLEKTKKFDKIFIWGNIKLKNNISLDKKKFKLIVKKKNYFFNFFWRIFFLPIEIRKYQCKKTLSMDGISNFSKDTENFTFFQNLIPFNPRTILEYRLSISFFKFLIINIISKISSYFCNGYIFTSEQSKKLIYNKLYKKIPYLIVPHGVNEIFNSNTKYIGSKRSDTLKIICISQIDIYKNYLNLLKAILILIKRNVRIKLTIVGNVGNNTYYKKCLEVSNLINSIRPNTVIFKGELSDVKIKELLKSHDMMIYPSICESWGMAIQEALVSGVQVLCSNQLGHEKYFKKQISFFNPFDVNDIVKNIINFKKKKINISRNRDVFNWSVSIKRFLNFIGKDVSYKNKNFKLKSFSNFFVNQLNLNNYFAFNFYSALSIFFFLYFLNYKELSAFYSIIYSLNNLIFFSLSANLRNLILSKSDTETINKVASFRIFFSCILIIIDFFFIKYFLNQKFIFELIILSIFTTLPWIKEIMICKFNNKEKLVKKIFFIDLSLYLVCTSLILYDIFYFILSLFLLSSANYLFFLLKNTFTKKFLNLQKIKYLNILFFSSLSISISTLLSRIILENYVGPKLAADFILFFSLVTLPATLITNTFGINVIKHNLQQPLIMKFILLIYFLFFIQYFIIPTFTDMQFLFFIGSFCGLIMIVFSYIRLVFFFYEDTIKNVLKNDIYISIFNIFLIMIFILFEINLYYFMIPVAFFSLFLVMFTTSKFLSAKIN